MRSPAPVPAAVRPATPPFASILCAVDLSAVGSVCARVAYALAGENAVVRLLHVAPPAPPLRSLLGEDPFAPRPFPPMAGGEPFAESLLADLVPDDATERGILTQTIVVEGDDPAGEISRAAAIAGADVVIAGTHGLSGFGHVLVGPVASAVVRSSPTPVLLVYPGRPDPSGRTLRLPPRSIVCPTDLSARGNEAASVAYTLAGAASTVHLLHAWRRPFCPTGDPSQERLAGEVLARRGLHAVARSHAQREIWTEVHAVEDDDPTAAIGRVADATHADLIVLSTHGLTDRRRVPMGPVAAEAIRGHVPVVLVPQLGAE